MRLAASAVQRGRRPLAEVARRLDRPRHLFDGGVRGEEALRSLGGLPGVLQRLPPQLGREAVVRQVSHPDVTSLVPTLADDRLQRLSDGPMQRFALAREQVGVERLTGQGVAERKYLG
jgi:hypothetical protein